MSGKCTGLIGLIFGHKFKPIITLGSSNFGSDGVQCKSHVAMEMADKYRQQTFHGCICQRCGATKALDVNI